MEKEDILQSRPSTEHTLHVAIQAQPQQDHVVEESHVDPPATEKLTVDDSEDANTNSNAAQHGSKSNDDDNKEEEPQYVTGIKFLVIMTAITVVALLVFLDASIIATAIPRITNEFHSIPDIGWYGSAYLLANCSLQPLTGKFYTHFTSKWVFLIFLFLFELGSLLCGVAVSSNMLIVGRAVAGIGGSGLVNGALTILSASVPLEKRPAYLGICISFAQLGTISGPLIGGALTQYTTWRWCFYINLPAGGAAALLILAISIPDQVKRGEDADSLRTIIHKLDLPGFAIFAPAIIMLLLALEWGGNTYAWNSATVIGLIVGAVVVLGIFFVWEWFRGDDAMVPFPVIRNRIMWASCAVTFFMMASLLITTYYLPIWFQVVKDATPTMSGVDLLPMVLSQMLFATVSGFLVGKLGYYMPWVIISSVLQAISSGLLSTMDPDTSTAKWIGYQILAGSGRGMGIQMAFVAVQNALPPAVAPISTAIIIFCQYFGGALFVSVGQTIFSNGLRSALPVQAPGVSVDAVIEAGATNFRSVVTGEDQIRGVTWSYNSAVRDVFYLSAALCVAMFAFGWGVGWRDIRKKKAVTPEA